MRSSRPQPAVTPSSSCKHQPFFDFPTLSLFHSSCLNSRLTQPAFFSYPSCSGSDSAPHLLPTKSNKPAPAGVFTQPFATQLVLLALEAAVERGAIDEADVTQEHLEQFLSRAGRRFYKLPEPAAGRIVLERKGDKIPASIKSDDGAVEVGISKAGADVFTLQWV